MLAQRNPMMQVEAVEISEAGAQLARLNVSNSPWAEKIKVIQQNITDFAIENTEQSLKQYDCIVTNPPYFKVGTVSFNTAKQQSRHTLSFSHQDLLKVVVRLLSPQGVFSLILPATEGQQFIEKAANTPLFLNRLTEVLPKKDKKVERLLMEFGKEAVDIKEEQLVIQYEERNHYTPEYITLTKDFYLKM